MSSPLAYAHRRPHGTRTEHKLESGDRISHVVRVREEVVVVERGKAASTKTDSASTNLRARVTRDASRIATDQGGRQSHRVTMSRGVHMIFVVSSLAKRMPAICNKKNWT
jgi:phosphoenolpyruvate synthase/pyruvate phosphate dikinase